jgi:hypothetical protein
MKNQQTPLCGANRWARQRRLTSADLEEAVDLLRDLQPTRSQEKSLAFVFVWIESEGRGPGGKAPTAIHSVHPIRGLICSDALEFVCSAQVLTGGDGG